LGDLDINERREYYKSSVREVGCENVNFIYWHRLGYSDGLL